MHQKILYDLAFQESRQSKPVSREPPGDADLTRQHHLKFLFITIARV